jgi:hypothetical protein
MNYILKRYEEYRTCQICNKKFVEKINNKQTKNCPDCRKDRSRKESFYRKQKTKEK